jgi:predicted nucleic acid-binding Zn ribbon protein
MESPSTRLARQPRERTYAGAGIIACPVCGRPRKLTQQVCSPRCRGKRHRVRQAAKVREVRELLEAALRRLEDGR